MHKAFVFYFLNLVHDTAVLRLEVVALRQVFEEVAGGAAVHAFFEQSDQLLDVDVRLGIPTNRESVELFNELLVVNFFEMGSPLYGLKASNSLKMESQ